MTDDNITEEITRRVELGSALDDIEEDLGDRAGVKTEKPSNSPVQGPTLERKVVVTIKDKATSPERLKDIKEWNRWSLQMKTYLRTIGVEQCIYQTTNEPERRRAFEAGEEWMLDKLSIVERETL